LDVLGVGAKAGIEAAWEPESRRGKQMSSKFSDVLLVDDDRVVRTAMSEMLGLDGFRVRQATNGIDALTIVREDCPHIVITDWSMAPMDGIEFCTALRKENLPHYVYVILLTGRSYAEDLATGLTAGADDVIAKPVRHSELTARFRMAFRILALEGRVMELTRGVLAG
jgi:DNA-binding response OmpR family regulator